MQSNSSEEGYLSQREGEKESASAAAAGWTSDDQSTGF